MENTYLVYDDTKEALIIDPGCYEKEEKEELADFVQAHRLHIVGLVNTHCHLDHVFGNQWVKNTYDVPLSIHKEDESTLRAVETYAPAYGFHHFEPSVADHFYQAGDEVCFGRSVLEVLFTPGHAPGHVALVHRAQKLCLSGDVLFDGSIGRTDLPSGDADTLIKSIHEEIFPLGDDMVVYPGHGGETTVGKEKTTNPFCALSL